VKPAEAGEAAGAPAQAPPRKPGRKPSPKPKLSQAALTGREALNTFGELAAFWEARNRQESTEDEPAEATPTPAAEDSPPPGN